MSVAEEIENLYELKNKGIISQAEFEQQKAYLLKKEGRENEQPAYLSRNIYVLLAFFLGLIGVHNFYAGYKGRAIAQIILLLLSWLIVPALILYVWILVEMIAVKKDAKGRPMVPLNGWRIALIVLYALGSVGGLLSVIGVLAVGGIAGYSMAMTRYHANEVVNYAQSYATLANAACAQLEMNLCESVVPSFCETGLVPEGQTPRCSVRGNLIGQAEVSDRYVKIPLQLTSEGVCKAVANVTNNLNGVSVYNENCSTGSQSLSLVFSPAVLQLPK